VDDGHAITSDALEAVLEPLEAGHRVDLGLLEALTPEMLDARTPGGGMSVAQHLAHVAGSTKFWVSLLSPEAVAGLADLYDDEVALDGVAARFTAERDLERIRVVIVDTHAAMMGAIREARAEDLGDLPHASLAVFAAHMLVHAAHHRGQVLIALKADGHPLPDDDIMWGPWKAGAIS
jgi:uncharacterized damage-inducible protein DinB